MHNYFANSWFISLKSSSLELPVSLSSGRVFNTANSIRPFANLALAPEWGSSYMLQANIGAQRAAELFYTAEWIDADKALHLGVVADVLPDASLFDHAMAKAREIAQWPVRSLQEIKRSLRQHHLPIIDAAINTEQEAMMRMAGSPENIEAITAIFEKRAPNFKDL